MSSYKISKKTYRGFTIAKEKFTGLYTARNRAGITFSGTNKKFLRDAIDGYLCL